MLLYMEYSDHSTQLCTQIIFDAQFFASLPKNLEDFCFQQDRMVTSRVADSSKNLKAIGLQKIRIIRIFFAKY